ncbi:putative acylesterase/phospholipase RssA [Bradyrhizobium sp. JR6.1]
MRGSGIGGWLSALLVAAVAVGLAGCATVYNLPGNVPLGAAAADTNGVSDIPAYEDDLLLALSFSGGGTRAAAFSFGVLEELDRVRSSAAGTKTLLDRVDFVSGVSGGSVTAAYFGLKRRAALDDFRERFLLRNAEEGLKTRISLGNIGRALGGGVNDSQFTDWLDQNLFDGARFEALPDDRRPRVWINASDIYNRTPFVFGKTSFDALCSDIRSYRVAEAVAASAAVPLAFAPIVLQTYPGGCAAPLPSWLDRVRNDPNAQPLLRSYAEAQARYRGGSMRYVKLLDGGLVDNYGLSGLSIGLLAAQRPYEPLSERQAAKLRRILFLVVDAGPRHLRRFRADARRAEWCRAGVRGRRHRDRCQRALELRRLHVARQRLVRQVEALALRPVGGGSRQARRRRRLEVRRRRDLCRAARLRPARTGARRHPERHPDAAFAAAGAGRPADHRRRGRAALEQGLPAVPARSLISAPMRRYGLQGDCKAA